MSKEGNISSEELVSLLEEPNPDQELITDTFQKYNKNQLEHSSRIGVMPAAGNGTRMMPVTGGDAKELLEVGDRSMLVNASEPFLNSESIDALNLIVRPGKGDIIDHFEEQKPDEMDVGYSPVFNSEGLAESLYSTHNSVENTFGVILPDTYFGRRDFFDDLMNYHEQHELQATLGCVRVENPENHGVLDVENPELGEGEVKSVVEKPDSNPASNIVIAGAYIFEPEIYEKIEQNINNNNMRKGEYRLATSINDLDQVNYKVIDCGDWIDVGTPERLRTARKYASEQ